MKRNDAMPAVPSQGDRPKITYPSFCLSDEVAEEFLSQNSVEVDDELDAKVRLKVSGTRSDEYGQSVTLSVLNLTPEGQPSKGKPMEDQAESPKEEAKEEAEPEAKSKKKNPAIEKMIAKE